MLKMSTPLSQFPENWTLLCHIIHTLTVKRESCGFIASYLCFYRLLLGTLVGTLLCHITKFKFAESSPSIPSSLPHTPASLHHLQGCCQLKQKYGVWTIVNNNNYSLLSQSHEIALFVGVAHFICIILYNLHSNPIGLVPSPPTPFTIEESRVLEQLNDWIRIKTSIWLAYICSWRGHQAWFVSEAKT